MGVIEAFSTNNYLIVNKDLIRFFKDANRAVFFSFLINNYEYYAKSGYLEDGYFYITAEAIKGELFLSYHQQKKYLEEFEDLGLVQTALRGWPAKKFMKFNIPALELLKKDIDSYKLKQAEMKEFMEPKRKKSKDFFQELEEAIAEDNKVRFDAEADKLKNKNAIFKIFYTFKQVFGASVILNRSSFYKVKTLGVTNFGNVVSKDGIDNLMIFKSYLKMPDHTKLYSTEELLVKYLEFDKQMQRLKEIQENEIC